MKKPIFKITLLILWGGILSTVDASDKIRYFQSPTVKLEQDKVVFYLVDFQEDLGVDTLFQLQSKEALPTAYYRHIQSNVCFDGKCRMLVVTLYWNITGRYLGFELPKGEFLSKTDHEPFVNEEYERLHALLADSLSPLGIIAYEALVPKASSDSQKVDAISSPTAPDVLEYIIKGAAYTTYKLWHFVYGITQSEIQQKTVSVLSPSLLLQILDSPDLGDRIWALNHATPYFTENPLLTSKVLSLIHQDAYNLSETAIRVLPLTDEKVQTGLTEVFLKSNYAIQKLIINKLRRMQSLTPSTVYALASSLSLLSGELVNNVLTLFQKNQVEDVEIGKLVAKLLEHKNGFIADKAYQFLVKQKHKSVDTEQQLKVYLAKIQSQK
ncbi:hypothetical protein [Runella zeae]|uniref:hypothetical protein n=1 Tax=Runella zeae TaxID=94255 RepID=UPI002357303D|nr:hypothetical protein [Runella zeae]